MANVRQTNFSAGELEPKLWGRTDMAIFGKGLRRLRDFFVTPQGAAMTRPGTLYCGQAGGVAVRLLPFLYTDQQSYVLELTPGNIRFWSFGAQVQLVGNPYQVPTPWVHGEELHDIQFAQVGDVMTLCHPKYPAQELRRIVGGLDDGFTQTLPNWTLTPVVFTRVQPWFRDIGGAYATTAFPMMVSTHPDGTNVDPTIPAVAPDGSVSFPALHDPNHPIEEWSYVVTAVAQDNTGATFETLAYPVTQTLADSAANADVVVGAAPVKLCVAPDKAVTIRRLPTTASISVPSDSGIWRPLAYNIYRGRGTLFGFIGQTTTRDFVDVGNVPDYTVQPPQGQNPFEIRDASNTLVRTEYPAAVAYFQQRRVFGGTASRQGFVFASATGDYYDYDRHSIPIAGEALMFELAAARREAIRSLVAVNKLLIPTSVSSWSLAGQLGNPLDYDSVDARLEDNVGAKSVQPIVVHNTVLVVRSRGFGVHSIAYDNRHDTFVGNDLSTISQHFFLGTNFDDNPPITGSFLTGDRGVKSWCYAKEPFGLVWAVRNDGRLLSMQFDGGGAGWSMHTTTPGWFTSICAVPEGNEDVVYVATIRPIQGSSGKPLIERLTSRVITGSPGDSCCTDCSGISTAAPTQTLTNVVPHLAGLQVYVTAVGNAPQGPITVGPTGTVQLPVMPRANALDGSNVATLYVGLGFQPELETLDIAQSEARTRQKTVTEVAFEVDNSQGLQAGQDFDNLVPWRQRQVSDSYGVPSNVSGLVVVPVKGTWDAHARAALRQTSPLPLTVLGITRRIDAGDA